MKSVKTIWVIPFIFAVIMSIISIHLMNSIADKLAVEFAKIAGLLTILTTIFIVKYDREFLKNSIITRSFMGAAGFMTVLTMILEWNI